MKDQFNKHDLASHPLQEHIQFVADEMGFILADRTGAAGKSVGSFGPYFIEQSRRAAGRPSGAAS